MKLRNINCKRTNERTNELRIEKFTMFRGAAADTEFHFNLSIHWRGVYFYIYMWRVCKFPFLLFKFFSRYDGKVCELKVLD